jgi:dynein heavy chain 2
VRTCLFIEDHQLLLGEFLEYLNSLISAGEVPGLYSPEELEPLLAQLKDEMSSQYEHKTMFELFVSRIKTNLSIVMSLDFTHPKYLANCASNPALFSKCNIIWCEGWTKESLVTVARNELKELSNQIGKPFDQIVGAVLTLHKSADSLGASPLAFMNLLHCFKQTYSKIRETSGGQSKHLIAGLEKLEEARVTVDHLSRKAGEQKILLKQKKAEASQALAEITKSMEQKAERKQEVEALQGKCAEDQQLIAGRKASVEHELSGVQPEVDAARAAVGDLKPANLNEIKAFRMPPDAVSDVLQGVLRLMGQEDTSWNAMKRFLGQPGVIQGILNFDATAVSVGIRNKVNKLIESKPMSFEQASITAVSRACAPLAAWVKANVMYSEVLLRIQPLTSELVGLERQLEKSQARVDHCRAQLHELDEATQVLNEDFAKKTQAAGLLAADLKHAEDTLAAASSLLQQLSGENARWRNQVDALEREMALVPMKSLLSSGYITYLGGENEGSRAVNLQSWCGALGVDDFNFRTFLASEAQLLTYKKEGLPADSLSMENAVMILNSVRTPLIIDPATQASEWLKKSLLQSKGAVEILNHQDRKFNTTLELAIRFGKVLVIQEVDGIESLLFPVLRKDLNQQGPRQVVQIGDKAVDYNPAFSLFLTTRDQFVEIAPNSQALVTNVNFTVTKSGLEGQLLSITINFEQPELESRKTQLLEEEERLQIQLAGYEKQLLEELVNSEGNILENKKLIDSLNQTKA